MKTIFGYLILSVIFVTFYYFKSAREREDMNALKLIFKSNIGINLAVNRQATVYITSGDTETALRLLAQSTSNQMAVAQQFPALYNEAELAKLQERASLTGLPRDTEEEGGSKEMEARKVILE